MSGGAGLVEVLSDDHPALTATFACFRAQSLTVGTSALIEGERKELRPAARAVQAVNALPGPSWQPPQDGAGQQRRRRAGRDWDKRQDGTERF